MPVWELNYGFEGRFRFEMESERVVAAHVAPDSLSDPRNSIADALAHPTEYPPLDQCVIPDDRIVLVLDRHTPCSTELIAEVWESLARRGVNPTDVTILHPADFRGPSPQDPRTALDDSVREELRWVVHDSTVSSDCAYLATTASGERVYLSRIVMDADVVIPIGPLSFDPVLGYRGTYSVLYPGLSDVDAMRKAVGQGHDELTPDDSRPLRQLIEEVAWLLGVQFAVQVIPASGTADEDLADGCTRASGTGDCCGRSGRGRAYLGADCENAQYSSADRRPGRARTVVDGTRRAAERRHPPDLRVPRAA
jgi:nickel-dependent lactate racemase